MKGKKLRNHLTRHSLYIHIGHSISMTSRMFVDVKSIRYFAPSIEFWENIRQPQRHVFSNRSRKMTSQSLCNPQEWQQRPWCQRQRRQGDRWRKRSLQHNSHRQRKRQRWNESRPQLREPHRPRMTSEMTAMSWATRRLHVVLKANTLTMRRTAQGIELHLWNISMTWIITRNLIYFQILLVQPWIAYPSDVREIINFLVLI